MAAVHEIVVLLLTDVEGSSKLWQEHRHRMKDVLDRLDELVHVAVMMHDGVLEKPRGEGDSHFIWFRLASNALRAAVELQKRLARARWPEGIKVPVRIALHAGEVQRRDLDFAGVAVNRAARIRSVAHGGQIIASRTVVDLAGDALGDEIQALNMGWHRVRDLPGWNELFQIWAPGLPREFAPLVTLDAGLPPLAAIVFLDVHRSLKAANSMQPSDRRALWGVFVEIFMTAFTRARGVCYQHLGDGCMALFADPLTAVDFVRDARASVEALDLSLKAVIHLGRVEMMYGIAHGGDIPTAGALVAKAIPNKILVTAAAAALIDYADDIIIVGPEHPPESAVTRLDPGAPTT